MKIAILISIVDTSIDKWNKSCEKYRHEYKFVSIDNCDWLEQLTKFKPDFCVLRPPGTLSYAKQMYDERVYIISSVLKIPVYPSFEEVIVYENKRILSDYLKAKNIPHPKTYVFYLKDQAIKFASEARYPLVAKTNIGASGSGVKILRSKKDLISYIRRAFSKGISRRKGPNKNSGSPKTWTKKAIFSPRYFLKKLKLYKRRSNDTQKNFLILQEYIQHDYEWRVVKIGESYFAHKKTKIGEMASGTKEKIYDNPPLKLFDFTKEVCDSTKFYSQAVDIFESPKGGYLVNEIQTIFGQSDSYQMKVDGKIGRYVYNDGWEFEEGDFNTNESYDLRLEHAVKLFTKEV